MAFCLNVLNFFLDKVKFYDGRQTSWCAGNDALAEVGFNINLSISLTPSSSDSDGQSDSTVSRTSRIMVYGGILLKPFKVFGPRACLLFVIQYSSIWNHKIRKN